MKEFKIEDVSPLEAVKSKIWMMFDILRRNVNISSEDYPVVLFLLSAFKDGLISPELNYENQNLKHPFIEALHKSNNELSNQYAPIIPIFETSLQRLNGNGLRLIFNALAEINKQVLTENFPVIFDSVLYQISQSQGRYAGEFIQPVELTRFICELADLKKDAEVFNPFAGLASFGVYLNRGQDYLGQELNRKTWALGAVRIMAHERPGNTKYVCDDSILHWPAPSEKFDLIVSNPPFGIRLQQQYRDIASNYRTIGQFLIEKGIHSLKQNGKLIAILPQGFLYEGMHEEQLTKEYLVEKDLIDTIISLPGGLLLNTGMSSIILVLSTKKMIPGAVKFINAKNFLVSKGPREKILDDYKLIGFIRDGKKDDNVIRIIPNEQIRAKDYNLSFGRYFQRQIDGVKLGKILELVRGRRGNLPGTGKLIRIRDLKNDKVDFTLDISSIEETELRRPDINLLSESCLLLAMRWRTLKPTFFEFKGKPIFTRLDILPFKVNESIADKAYLINELHSDYVQEQLESYQLGSVIPLIRRDDLMEIIIKLPSLEEQRAKIQGIHELSDKIKNLQDDQDAIVHGSAIKHFNEFASLKHTLGRPRQNILDWTDNLLNFLDKKQSGFEALNKAFAEFYGNDIISVLKEMKGDVNFMTDVLEKGENGLVLSDFEKEIIPLSEVNNLINELSNNGFNFKIKKLLLKGQKLKGRGIYANKTLFKTLLDNILTNANKYAFDKQSPGNEVFIELSEVDDLLSLEIKNNGKPFPKNFDREKFTTKYSTADSNNGSGLGGYDIHRIATDFNNPDWVLSLNDDPFYPVRFKFRFQIKLIN